MRLWRTEMEGRNSLSLYSPRHWNSNNHIWASLYIGYDYPWPISVSLNESIFHGVKEEQKNQWILILALTYMVN